MLPQRFGRSTYNRDHFPFSALSHISAKKVNPMKDTGVYREALMDVRPHSLYLSSWVVMRWANATWFSQRQSHMVESAAVPTEPQTHRSSSLLILRAKCFSTCGQQHQRHPDLLNGPLGMGPSVPTCPLDPSSA